MEGVAILKVGQSAHLTSFPQHSRSASPGRAFWLVSIWKAGFGFDGRGTEDGEIRGAAA